jgi:hypothetical protein
MKYYLEVEIREPPLYSFLWKRTDPLNGRALIMSSDPKMVETLKEIKELLPLSPAERTSLSESEDHGSNPCGVTKI